MGSAAKIVERATLFSGLYTCNQVIATPPFLRHVYEGFSRVSIRISFPAMRMAAVPLMTKKG